MTEQTQKPNAAFQVFLGTTNLAGGLTDQFIIGIDAALYASLALLILAGILSFVRGKDARSATAVPERIPVAPLETERPQSRSG